MAFFTSTVGGVQGRYNVYWVQRSTAGSTSTYQIRYRACTELAVCTDRVAQHLLFRHYQLADRQPCHRQQQPLLDRTRHQHARQ